VKELKQSKYIFSIFDNFFLSPQQNGIGINTLPGSERSGISLSRITTNISKMNNSAVKLIHHKVKIFFKNQIESMEKRKEVLGFLFLKP